MMDWSEWSAIDAEPGRAMLAVKLEMRMLLPRTDLTMSMAMGCVISCRKMGEWERRLKMRMLEALGSRCGR